jgi:hypothetical protein
MSNSIVQPYISAILYPNYLQVDIGLDNGSTMKDDTHD